MVQVSDTKGRRRRNAAKTLCGLAPEAWLGIFVLIITLIMVLSAVWVSVSISTLTQHEEASLRAALSPQKDIGIEASRNEISAIPGVGNDNDIKKQQQQQQQQQEGISEGIGTCPYQSLADLTEEERYPVASEKRHMVQPPQGGNVTLVCCQTTKGPWNILVHEKWAPIGAKNFLRMVKTKYFDRKVPLMRCVKNFLCQFGLNGKASRQFHHSLPDDPPWLPQGPKHRKNDLNVKRFQKGYFAYAGAGPESRSNQLFVALQDNGFLAGGSPWEVPWGELVGKHSFQTLSQIYTGYGEKGPSQGFLHSHDSSDPSLAEDFPLLDYVESCQVVDNEVQSEEPRR